jgi:hypothetical protein
MGRTNADTEPTDWYAGFHQHHGFCLMLAAEPPKGGMSGVARAENQIGFRKTSAVGECGADPADESAFPGEGNPVDLTGHAPTYRLGQSERLVFVA